MLDLIIESILFGVDVLEKKFKLSKSNFFCGKRIVNHKKGTKKTQRKQKNLISKKMLRSPKNVVFIMDKEYFMTWNLAFSIGDSNIAAKRGPLRHPCTLDRFYLLITHPLNSSSSRSN